MRTVARVILVAALACALGCARPDWIDRTLVTVDVTGRWEGSAFNAQGASSFWFYLVQEGARVKGTARGLGLNRSAGRLEGTVTDDVFTFKLTDDPFTGEMKVSGDEMTGLATIPYGYARGTLVLRRVSSPTPPGSPKP